MKERLIEITHDQASTDNSYEEGVPFSSLYCLAQYSMTVWPEISGSNQRYSANSCY